MPYAQSSERRKWANKQLAKLSPSMRNTLCASEYLNPGPAKLIIVKAAPYGWARVPKSVSHKLGAISKTGVLSDLVYNVGW